ncbi:MAG TPA: hypothetical protein VLK32_00585 [Bacillota bacterium]|nr:hypothetical protein [Bacillota bacterium]
MTVDRESERDAAPGQEGRHAAWEALDGNSGRLLRGRAGRRRRPTMAAKDEDEPRVGMRDEGGERVQLDSLDILAFIIAFFQLLLPPALIMVGVLVLLYLLLRLWAGI